VASVEVWAMSEWQPTEEEVRTAALIIGNGDDTAAARCAERVLAAVGPAIAARALREAASIARDYDATETDLLCRARADVIDPLGVGDE
jgi:hypothetical protein